MQRVEVNKGLLIGLAAVTVVAVLGLAFLLGRESSRGRAPQDAMAATASPQSGAARIQAPSLTAPAATTPPLPQEPVTDATRTPVAAYFNAVDHIQSGGMSDGPESTAQGIVGSLMKGDSTGFDRMIQQAESARASLAAIAPPPPCAAYHRESLASLDEGLALMRSLKTAMDTQDAGAQMASLTAQANTLRARSEALQREEQALRQRYGVPAKP